MKIKLTAEQLAALSAGATLQAVLAAANLTEDEVELPEAAQPAANADLDSANEALAAAQAELATANEGMTKLQADLDALTATHAALVNSSKAMAEVIQKRVNDMSVALGGKAPEPTEDFVELAQKHQTLAESFAKRYPVGGVTKPTAKVSEPTTKPQDNLAVQRMLAAAQAIPVI